MQGGGLRVLRPAFSFHGPVTTCDHEELKRSYRLERTDLVILTRQQPDNFSAQLCFSCYDHAEANGCDKERFARKIAGGTKMLFGEPFQSLDLRTSTATIHLVHGGAGPPLLLLHGYPQTHVMWHKVAPLLASAFHVVCPDLRGYGDSSKPKCSPDHSAHSKRAMATDMIEVMELLGYREFYVAGHDRGARVTHRMALDHPGRISKACVMDILPTHYMFATTNQHVATGYYHWFFLIQPDGLPEHMIGADPAYYLTEKLRRWGAPGAVFNPEAVNEYLRCFRNPETIHSTCEDYRAAASIDLEHDAADLTKSVSCPLLVLWGAKGFVHRSYDVLSVWRKYADHVTGKALSCGHFLPEELPEEVSVELLRFLA